MRSVARRRAKKTRPSRVAWPCAAGLLAVLGAGCDSKQSPCFDVKVGDRIAVTVVGIHTPPGTPPVSGDPTECGFGLDVYPGLVLEATVVQSSGFTFSCAVPIPEYAPFDGGSWTLSDAQDPAGSPDILNGNYEETAGACSGAAQVTVTVSEGADPFAPTEAGAPPNVTLIRRFNGAADAAPGCPTVSCLGQFVVNLARL